MTPEHIIAVTGLAAVIASLLVAFYTVRSQGKFLNKQLHADVVLGSRRQWLSELRDALAEYVATNISVASGAGLSSASGDMIKYERATYLRAKIIMLLNPKESSHQELLDVLHRAMAAAIRPPDDNVGEVAVSTNDLLELAQQVLKSEWEVIKKLEAARK